MFELRVKTGDLFLLEHVSQTREKSFLVRGPLLKGGLDSGLMGPPKSEPVNRHKLIMHLTLDGLVSYWMTNSQSYIVAAATCNSPGFRLLASIDF
jgi:hypothetical protein